MKQKLSGLILTGGQGTRLRPLTLHKPKPLLPIANHPFLVCQLHWLRQHHIHNVTLCMADSSAPYRQLIRDQKKLGTQVHCSKEPRPLGTAGALKNAEKFLKSDEIFIFNGDVLTDVDLTKMLESHRKAKAQISVSLIPVTDPSMFGLAVLNKQKRILNFLEKPTLASLPKQKHYLINAGTYIFSRSIFDRIPKGENFSVEKQLFPQALKDGVVMNGFEAPLQSYWLDIGTPQKYLQANIDVLQGTILKNFGRAIGNKTKIAKDVEIDESSVIGNHCVIEKGCSIRQSVILDHAHIQEASTIEGALIGQAVKIGHHSSISPGRAIGDRSILTPYSKV